MKASATLYAISKKGMRLSDIAGSLTISKEEWDRVEKVFEIQKRMDAEKRNKLLRK